MLFTSVLILFTSTLICNEFVSGYVFFKSTYYLSYRSRMIKQFMFEDPTLSKEVPQLDTIQREDQQELERLDQLSKKFEISSDAKANSINEGKPNPGLQFDFSKIVNFALVGYTLYLIADTVRLVVTHQGKST